MQMQLAEIRVLVKEYLAWDAYPTKSPDQVISLEYGSTLSKVYNLKGPDMMEFILQLTNIFTAKSPTPALRMLTLKLRLDWYAEHIQTMGSQYP